MRLTCDALKPHHPYTLLRTENWTGTIEIRCPACKTIRRFGDGMEPTTDIRCPNTFKNSGHGWCASLAFRISLDASGTVRYTCQNCRTQRTLRLDTPAYAATT